MALHRTELVELMEDTTEQTDLAEKHRQFKIKASRVAWEFADARNLCSDFDRAMERVGLAPRPDYCGSLEGSLSCLTGDGHEQDFQEWKMRTARLLAADARRYGYSGWQEAMEEAGFPALRKVDALIKGTFEVPITAYVFEGDPLINAVRDDSHVMDLVYANWQSERVQWKVVDASVPEEDIS